MTSLRSSFELGVKSVVVYDMAEVRVRCGSGVRLDDH